MNGMKTAAFDVREIIGAKAISHEEVEKLGQLLITQLQHLGTWIPNPGNRPYEQYAVHWS